MPSLYKAVLAVLGLASALQIAKADALYNVAFDTSSLVGHPAGPFFLAIELTDGSGVDDANNTVTLQAVDFFGGSAVPGTLTSGGASGSFDTGISITDSSFLNVFEQQFVPGSQLSFTLGLTSNDDAGGVPDGVALFILDSYGIPLPTLAPEGDPFITAALMSTGDVVDAYGSDPSRPPSMGGAISMPAPTLTPVGVSPEPPSIFLCAGGAVLCCGLIRGRSYKGRASPG